MSATNAAATILMRELLARIEEGSTEVLELAAGEGLLSIKFAPAVLENSGPVARAPRLNIPGGLAAGDHCPICYQPLIDASGSITCRRCGPVG